MQKSAKIEERAAKSRFLPGKYPGQDGLGAGANREQHGRVAYADLANARKRERTEGNTVGVWVQNGAASLVILSFVGLLFCVLYREGDLPNKDIFNILLGILGTVVVQIFQYWFGSSAGLPGAGDGAPGK